MIPVEKLRDAAAQAVENGSLRGVARQIGISAPGLSGFLEGTVPRNATVKQLRRWYVQRTPPESVSPEVARAALHMLLDTLGEPGRSKCEAQILDVIAEGHRLSQTVPPGWLSELREDDSSRTLEPQRSDQPSPDRKSSVLADDEEDYLRSGDGRSFLSVYARHRDAVRGELESTGLQPQHAEALVGLVFTRLMDAPDDVDRTVPLLATLRQIARTVAADARAAARECSGSPFSPAATTARR
jgi:hypothetical protein